MIYDHEIADVLIKTIGAKQYAHITKGKYVVVERDMFINLLSMAAPGMTIVEV